MRAPRLRWLVGIAPFVLIAAHCKELEFGSTLAPRNDCVEHACEKLTQDGSSRCDPTRRYCQVNTSFDFFLLVSTAAGSPPYYESFTAAMTSSDLKVRVTTSSCPEGETCVYTPPLGSEFGRYSVDPATASRVGIDVGGGSGAYTSIPHHTVLHPLHPRIKSAPTDVGLDMPVASDYGLPLAPVLAPLAMPGPQIPPGTAPPAGPFGSTSIGWYGRIPFWPYLRIITPDPPYDQGFPPREDVVVVDASVGAPIDFGDEVSLDPDASRKFKISPDPAGPRDLTGFTAVLQNKIRRRNISRVATLHAGTNDVTMFTSGHPRLTDVPVELVVAPPAGMEGVPSLVVAATPVIPANQTYPALPPPVTLSGTVVGPRDDGVPVAVPSTVVIQSVDDPTAIVSALNVPLRYETRIRTNANGTFEAKLPVGRYDVAIFPTTGLLPDNVHPALLIETKDTALNVTGPTQKTFSLVRQTPVQGSVVLLDGTAVAEAEVEARPAVQPGEQNEQPTNIEPPLPLPPFAQSMRPAQTTTDASGAFSLLLDQGYYDIIVRPKDGTRFPWVVSTSHKIANTPVTLDRIVVPAPIVVSITLLMNRPARADPVREAMVRAFAVPRGDGKSVAVEIGRTLTDSNGKLELFLAGPPN